MSIAIGDLITPDRIVCKGEARSRKRALELLSGALSLCATSLGQGEAFDSIVGRERLGTTGVGSGVAIPHGRIEGLDGIVGAFVQLKEPVDYDAPDGEPVDLLFGLLVPSECNDEHLATLASLARLFTGGTLCDELRNAGSQTELYKLLTGADGRHRAMG